MSSSHSKSAYKPIQPSSYWALFVFHFSVPTFLDAWRQFIANSSYSSFLLALHRSIKFACKCVCLICSQSKTNASEIGRALRLAHASRISDASYYLDEPDGSDEVSGVRSGTDQIADGLAVWRIDWALRHSVTLMNEKATLNAGSTDTGDVALAILSVKSIDPLFAPTLVLCLNRIRAADQSIQAILERSNTPYNPETDSSRLKDLWKLLKPEKPLESLHTKSWQDIGFQGTDPSTDFRGSAMLGLDALILFGHRYGKVAQDLVAEAVDGGPSWYPWALASINITWWCISLAKQHQLQYFLLSPMQDTSYKEIDVPIELLPFLILQTKLTFLFHSFWRRLDPPPNVMQFESKFKVFKASVECGLVKGLIGGQGVGWIDEIEGDFWKETDL
ncbi:ELMO/CED-12 family-domain-containing protein [Melampsora americana]|nr:ELMO/CED-12 family-domain-containing protein [Melampsora americana]